MTVTYRLNSLHLKQIAVISKHLDAMDAELMAIRDESGWDWGGGFFLQIDNLKVSTDADEFLGTFIGNDHAGYDFTQGEK